MSDLNPRQQRFVYEYLKDLNGTQAAIRTGYARSGADVQAVRLLADERIAGAIQRGKDRHAKAAKVTASKVVAELAKLGFANMRDYLTIDNAGQPHLNWQSLTRDQAAALQEVTVEEFTQGTGEDALPVRRVRFKLADKRASLVDLGKHLGLFKDRLELSGPDGSAIATHVEVEFVDADQRRDGATGDDPGAT